MPFDDGVLTFGRTGNGESPNTFSYPDATSAWCEVQRGVRPDNSGTPRNWTRIRSRPDISSPWDIIESTTPVLPASDFDLFDDSLIGSWGAVNLDPGGIMFADNVLLSGLSGSAEEPIIALISESFDLEIEAFVELNKDTAKAEDLILSAGSKITDAVVALTSAMDQGTLQRRTKARKALKALQEAGRNDFDAFNERRSGNIQKAGELLLMAAANKARAELFMEGHAPRSRASRDGKGGFDDGDPDFVNKDYDFSDFADPIIFTDGFESGDTSAWSR